MEGLHREIINFGLVKMGIFKVPIPCVYHPQLFMFCAASLFPHLFLLTKKTKISIVSKTRFHYLKFLTKKFNLDRKLFKE